MEEATKPNILGAEHATRGRRAHSSRNAGTTSVKNHVLESIIPEKLVDVL